MLSLIYTALSRKFHKSVHALLVLELYLGNMNPSLVLDFPLAARDQPTMWHCNISELLIPLIYDIPMLQVYVQSHIHIICVSRANQVDSIGRQCAGNPNLASLPPHNERPRDGRISLIHQCRGDSMLLVFVRMYHRLRDASLFQNLFSIWTHYWYYLWTGDESKHLQVAPSDLSQTMSFPDMIRPIAWISGIRSTTSRSIFLCLVRIRAIGSLRIGSSVFKGSAVLLLTRTYQWRIYIVNSDVYNTGFTYFKEIICIYERLII